MASVKKPSTIVKKPESKSESPPSTSPSSVITNPNPISITSVVKTLPVDKISRLALLFHESSGRSESKLEILSILAKGERSVGELGSVIDLSPSAVSQHLNKLKAYKIVECRRVNHNQFYNLRGDFKDELVNLINEVFKTV